MVIKLEGLLEACKQYKEHEGRADYFKSAAEIVEDHPLQAVILLMATWNKSRFGYFMKDSENMVRLGEALEQTKPLFNKFVAYGWNIQNVDFDEIGDEVKDIYSKFSTIPGIEYTGASKAMCLLNQNLFVMWDASIREAYEVGNFPKDYLTFLKMMQENIKGVRWEREDKTLAKAIDEYNYVKYTLKK